MLLETKEQIINPFKYKWMTMQRGENLFIECSKDQAIVVRSSILRSCRTYIKREFPEMLFKTMLVNNGLEIWRLK